MILDTILISVLALMLLVQAIALAAFVFVLGRGIRAMESSWGKLGGRANSLVDGTHKALDRLQPIVKGLPVWAPRVSKASSAVATGFRRLDPVSGHGFVLMKKGVHHFSEGSGATITAISRANYRVHRAIINPASKLSSALSAIQSVIFRLISGGDSSEPVRDRGDQQIFI